MLLQRTYRRRETMLNSFGCKYCLRRYLKDHFSRIDWCNLINLRVPLCISIYLCNCAIELSISFFFFLEVSRQSISHIQRIGKWLIFYSHYTHNHYEFCERYQTVTSSLPIVLRYYLKLFAICNISQISQNAKEFFFNRFIWKLILSSLNS